MKLIACSPISKINIIGYVLCLHLNNTPKVGFVLNVLIQTYLPVLSLKINLVLLNCQIFAKQLKEIQL